MSNVIKGYTVRYGYDEKKILDFNERADEIQQKYLDEYHLNHLDEFDSEIVGGEFIEGIEAVRLEVSEESEELTNEQQRLLNEQQKAYNEKRLEEVEEEISAMLEKAKMDADLIIKEAKESAKKEKQAVIEKAREDGYKDGIKKGEKEISSLKDEFQLEKQNYMEEYKQMVKEMEPEMVSLVLSLVNKLTGVLLEDRKELIVYLVEQAIYESDASKQFMIHVSKEDYKYLISKRDELLLKLKEGTELEIIEDAVLKKGQCTIDADTRIIDCSMDVQLQNLTECMKMLAGR